jgi:uncharacterized ParB-like nuclease family protein
MPSRGGWRRTTSSGLLQSGVVEADRLDMRLEFHQLERRLEHLRVHQPEAQRKLLASLAVNGQQMPIVVVAAGQADRYLVIDGYQRIRALEQLGRDTVEAVVWTLSEPEALLLDRSLRWGEHDTALEQGWLLYEAGDVVRYSRGSKSVGIEGGSYATVAAINPSANLLTVEKASCELTTYDPRRLTGVSVQFTAPEKSLGVANRDLAVIESISPDCRIAARLDENRKVEFNATEHRHFDHGYAVTSHSARGLTAEWVLIYADTGVHPDLLNSRFAYVSVSRASFEARIFTDDATRLPARLSTEVDKSVALDFFQAVGRTPVEQSVLPGIQMGL